jgi:hypothetical protein
MKRGDNTVTTNTLSTRPKSSTIPYAMFASAAVGRDGQGLGKVEGLVAMSCRES